MKPSIFEYAMNIANVVATRSDDPIRKVGAVCIDTHKRIIATGYNGLPPGIEYDPSWTLEQTSEMRRLHMIHAEQNMCSMITRYQSPDFVAITTSPCVSCLKLLLAHGITCIYYQEEYHDIKEVRSLVKFYNIDLYKI